MEEAENDAVRDEEKKEEREASLGTNGGNVSAQAEGAENSAVGDEEEKKEPESSSLEGIPTNVKGQWSEGEITDTQILWKDGSVDPITLSEDGTVLILIKDDETRTATVQAGGNELVWSDGTSVWSRTTKPPSKEVNLDDVHDDDGYASSNQIQGERLTLALLSLA